MTLEGKGFYIWKVKDCEAGNANAIAEAAKNAGLGHVLIKIANGVYPYNYDWNKKVDQVKPVVQALHTKGIRVWGWHYVYGDKPIDEARIAVRRVKELELDGYAIDAETEYKMPGKNAAATQFMKELRLGLPNTLVALSSYRYPSYHPQLPWREFLSKCDYNMPQVYWIKANNPGSQLQRCVREFQDIAPYRPIIPTGAAFSEQGWTATAAEITEFLRTAQSLNVNAANFWSWDYCKNNLPNLWKVIADYPWSTTPLPADITQNLITADNTHDPDKVANLYHPTAVHINASRTIQGRTAIRAWYQTLFTQILPNAKFTLTGSSGTGNSRQFTWTATSTAGSVLNGNDTLGLQNGQISYHYTFFTIS